MRLHPVELVFHFERDLAIGRQRQRLNGRTESLHSMQHGQQGGSVRPGLLHQRVGHGLQALQLRHELLVFLGDLEIRHGRVVHQQVDTADQNVMAFLQALPLACAWLHQRQLQLVPGAQELALELEGHGHE